DSGCQRAGHQLVAVTSSILVVQLVAVTSSILVVQLVAVTSSILVVQPVAVTSPHRRGGARPPGGARSPGRNQVAGAESPARPPGWRPAAWAAGCCLPARGPGCCLALLR